MPRITGRDVLPEVKFEAIGPTYILLIGVGAQSTLGAKTFLPGNICTEN